MPKNIPVMLSRSSKGEHYNGLGGVCKGGTASERERLRQTAREREREVAWKVAI